MDIESNMKMITVNEPVNDKSNVFMVVYNDME